MRRRVGELLISMSSSWCRRIFAGPYFEWTDNGERLEDETFLPAAVKRLTTTAGDGSLPRSKMGGKPDLLPGTAWPMRPSTDRDPTAFKGQPGLRDNEVVTTYRLPLDGAVAFLSALNPRLGEGCAARLVTRQRRSPGSVAPGSPGELVKLIVKACDETVTSFPLAFMLQINLAHVESPALPSSGLLSFFYDMTYQPWGHRTVHASSCRVLYTPGHQLAQLERRGPPTEWNGHGHQPQTFKLRCLLKQQTLSGLRLLGQADVYQGRCLGQQAQEMLESYGRPMTPPPGLTKTQEITWRESLEAEPPPAVTQSQVKGWRAQQEEDWCLLLQLYSQPYEPAMNIFEFGSFGCLYFMIRRDHLAMADFGHVKCILQC